jgi:hypothetical protein
MDHFANAFALQNGIRNDNQPENLELWVKSQPAGARGEDLVSFAREILKTYGDLFPEKENRPQGVSCKAV